MLKRSKIDNISISMTDTLTNPLSRILAEATRPVKVLYGSSYIPRRCGIASFVKDLTNAINLINPLSNAQIIAFDNAISKKVNYPPEVVLRVCEDEIKDYRKAAEFINKSQADIFCLQHEFGLFGSDNGRKITELLKDVKIPIITTLHTVLGHPYLAIKEIVVDIARASRCLVVMQHEAVEILAQDYGISQDKIAVIPHGVPDFPRFNPDERKDFLEIGNKVLMTSINLLSDVKGIEVAIKSLPKIIQKIPNFVYLAVGQTHPAYLRSLGGRDLYREHLIKIANDLDVADHVKFVNRYIDISEIVGYIGASDFYITPYLDPSQTSSGALAYAIGAGKAVISTPYVYAKEVLADGKGALVPFNNPDAIAQAVIDLWQNPDKKKMMEERAYRLGKTMTWINIAHQYFHLFQFSTGDSYDHKH